MPDWTVDPETGRSNSSPAYLTLVLAVDRLIRDSAHDLIGGRADRVAGLIVAQLAHKHAVGPLTEPDALRQWQAQALPALRELADELGDHLQRSIPPGPTRIWRWRGVVQGLLAAIETEGE